LILSPDNGGSVVRHFSFLTLMTLLFTLHLSLNTDGSVRPSFRRSSGSSTSTDSSVLQSVGSTWFSLLPKSGAEFLGADNVRVRGLAAVIFMNLTPSVGLHLPLLNLAGQDKSAYYHELFIRSKCFLSLRIQRIKIKGQGTRKPSSPGTETNFYNAPYLPPAIGHGKNPWTPPVCSLLPSDPQVDPGTGGLMSLNQLLASVAATFQNRQAQVAYSSISSLLELEAFHVQAHFEQICMEAMRQEIQMLPSFPEQPIAMFAGSQDDMTAGMALALFIAEQEDLAASSNRLQVSERGALE
jgi:hypothetical protein